MLLTIGQRLFVLRPGDRKIIDLLRDPTAQACILPSGQILYFAIPIPLDTLKQLSSPSLQALHLHLEGAANLLYNIKGMPAKNHVSYILFQIEDETQSRNDGSNIMPMRMPICTPESIGDVAVGSEIYAKLETWINEGLTSPPPAPYVDYTLDQATSDSKDARPSYLEPGSLSSYTSASSNDQFWRAYDSLPRTDQVNYCRGLVDILRNPHTDGWMLVPGPRIHRRGQKFAWSKDIPSPDVSPVPGETLLDLHQLRDISKRPLIGMQPSRHATNDTRGSSPVPSYGKSTHAPRGAPNGFGPWTERVRRFMAFVCMIHPFEVRLLRVGDLHVVGDECCPLRYTLSTFHGPNPDILTPPEWYSILGDYQHELGCRNDEELAEQLYQFKDGELPHVLWNLLAEGRSTRRTIYDIPRRCRRAVGSPPDTNMNGREWRKRFFDRNTWEDFASWRESLTDEELDEFYRRISREGCWKKGRESPCRLCDRHLEETQCDLRSEYEVSQNPNYKGFTTKREPWKNSKNPKSSTTDLSHLANMPLQEHLNRKIGQMDRIEAYMRYLHSLNLSDIVSATETKAINPNIDSKFQPKGLLKWLLSLTSPEFNCVDWVLLQKKPIDPTAPSHLRTRIKFLNAISLASLFLYCTGYVAVGTETHGLGNSHYMISTVPLPELNNAIAEWKKFLAAKENTPQGPSEHDLHKIRFHVNRSFTERERQALQNHEFVLDWDDAHWEYHLVDTPTSSYNTIRCEHQYGSASEWDQFTETASSGSNETFRDNGTGDLHRDTRISF